MLQLEWDEKALERLPADERKEVEAKLLRFREGIKANPTWGYFPHPRQQLFHETIGTRVRAFIAGNRAGKSHAGVMDDVIQAVDKDVLPPWLLPYKRFEPPFECRIITPDLTTTGEGVIVDKLRKLLPKSQLPNDKFHFDQRRMRLNLANGSTFQFLSTEQDLDKHGGSAVHRVHFDEEPDGMKGERIWVEANIRTIDYGGDILFTMTPTEGLTWTFDVLTEDGKPIQNDEIAVITASMLDNPHLDAKARDAALKGIKTQEERDARIEGRWVALEGLVYPEFGGRHVMPQHEIPRDEDGSQLVEIYVGIDPGYRHQAAAIYAYLDDHDTLVAFHEITIQKGTIRDLCQAIHSTNDRLRITPRWYVVDPQARAHSYQTGKTDLAVFAENGIFAYPGNNARGGGFSEIRGRLQDEPARLLVTANCAELIAQFKRYRWQKQGRGENAVKAEPVKRDDHCLDALRYLAMSDPYGPMIRVEAEVLSPADKAFRDSLTRHNRKENHHLGGVYF